MMTAEQKRATDALEKILSMEYESIEFRKRYRAYVDRLGPAILMNGLGQALATERAAAGLNPSKDDSKAHLRLYSNISGWLCSEQMDIYPGASDLIEALMSNPQDRYLMAQTEALAWLEWHKRFARAYLPNDSETDSA